MFVWLSNFSEALLQKNNYGLEFWVPFRHRSLIMTWGGSHSDFCWTFLPWGGIKFNIYIKHFNPLIPAEGLASIADCGHQQDLIFPVEAGYRGVTFLVYSCI